MSESVAFAYKPEAPTAGQLEGNIPGTAQIFDKLRDRGLQPYLSLGAEAAFTEAGVELATYDFAAMQARSAGTLALAEVAVIFNRLDRSLKLPDIPHAEALPPVINANASRSLAHDKFRAYQEVLRPSGLAIPTELVASGDDIEAFLEQQGASRFMIKPVHGFASRGVEKVARDELAERFTADSQLYGHRIIQPAYDLTVPFPKSVRPYSKEGPVWEDYDFLSAVGKSKELRVYGFHSPAGTAVFPVARTMFFGDQWFFIDPDSAPEQVVEGTRGVIASAAELSGASVLYGTVDYGYGSDGVVDPGWRAIEFNGKMPYLIGYDKHAGIADILRTELADQITATAAEHDKVSL